MNVFEETVKALLEFIIDLLNNIVSGLLHLVIDFVILIVNFTLMPIEAIISTFIPDYVDLVYHINDYLTLASSYLGYILDSVGFYSETITFLIAVLIFKLTIPLQTWIVKLAIRWYNALKT